MQDFTLITYKKLLQTLLIKGYSFQTLQDFIRQPEDKTVILRHDVDQAYRSQKPESAIRKEELGNRKRGTEAGGHPS